MDVNCPDRGALNGCKVLNIDIIMLSQFMPLYIAPSPDCNVFKCFRM